MSTTTETMSRAHAQPCCWCWCQRELRTAVRAGSAPIYGFFVVASDVSGACCSEPPCASSAYTLRDLEGRNFTAASTACHAKGRQVKFSRQAQLLVAQPSGRKAVSTFQGTAAAVGREDRRRAIHPYKCQNHVDKRGSPRRSAASRLKLLLFLAC